MNVIVVGAGLSGLYLTLRLQQHNIPVQLLEARPRAGGRILSVDKLDAGPAWFWPHQHRFRHLIDELELAAFPQFSAGQHLFESHTGVQLLNQDVMPVSLRIDGGMQCVVESLLSRIEVNALQFEQPVTKIALSPDRSLVTVSGQSFSVTGTHVVLCIPPRLVAGSLCMTPELPADTLSVLRNTPTWMAGHAKALIRYPSAFWRKQGKSGTVISHTGPLAEIHDATLDGADEGALFGFFSLTAQQRSTRHEQLPELVIEQLTRLFGEQASRPLSLKLIDWAQQPFTATVEDKKPLPYHPIYGLPQTTFWDRRLMLASTEASSDAGGYMEGALASAQRTLEALISIDAS